MGPSLARANRQRHDHYQSDAAIVLAYPHLTLHERRALLTRVAARLEPSALLLTLSDLEDDLPTRAAVVQWLVPRAFMRASQIEVVVGRHRLVARPDRVVVEVRDPRIFGRAQANRHDEVPLTEALDPLAEILVRYTRRHGELPAEARPFAALFWISPR